MKTAHDFSQYIEQHKDRYLSQLTEWLKIPSVSADSRHKGDVVRAAEYAAEQLKEAGADVVELCQTDGFPIVYGEKMIDPALPTILVYGHYDVQPADPLDLWHTPPFEPTVRDGKIYGRGTADDKGQAFMHIKAFEALNKLDSLFCNVKFMIEGEEEVGSKNLGIFVKNNKKKLEADVILISDTSMISPEHPSITTGLKGLSYMEVEVIGPNRDLHSGTYGGAVANPIIVLSKMIASLIDENNRVTIPGFYDKVLELNAEERQKIAKAPFDEKEYKAALEVDELAGEKGYTILEQLGIRPTLDVNGIWGGYTGEGAKTVLPSKAYAKISMRLVPNQQSDEISDLFAQHLKKIAPASVKVKVTPHHGGEPAVTPIDSLAFKAAENAFEEGWGKKPIPTRDGGSIPIVALFEKELQLNSILMGMGLDSDAIHSPNESFSLFNFYKGIETAMLFHKHFSLLYKK
jgi:acetylornithine deacetylase/succinyl-diaminopimelate desuccinylase-like protein